eukprot:scaffold5157_cov34-Attheya_sp.AAC.3
MKAVCDIPRHDISKKPHWYHVFQNCLPPSHQVPQMRKKATWQCWKCVPDKYPAKSSIAGKTTPPLIETVSTSLPAMSSIAPSLPTSKSGNTTKDPTHPLPILPSTPEANGVKSSKSGNTTKDPTRPLPILPSTPEAKGVKSSIHDPMNTRSASLNLTTPVSSSKDTSETTPSRIPHSVPSLNSTTPVSSKDPTLETTPSCIPRSPEPSNANGFSCFRPPPLHTVASRSKTTPRGSPEGFYYKYGFRSDTVSHQNFFIDDEFIKQGCFLMKTTVRALKIKPKPILPDNVRTLDIDPNVVHKMRWNPSKERFEGCNLHFPTVTDIMILERNESKGISKDDFDQCRNNDEDHMKWRRLRPGHREEEKEVDSHETVVNNTQTRLMSIPPLFRGISTDSGECLWAATSLLSL